MCLTINSGKEYHNNDFFKKPLRAIKVIFLRCVYVWVFVTPHFLIQQTTYENNVKLSEFFTVNEHYQLSLSLLSRKLRIDMNTPLAQQLSLLSVV